MSKSQRIREYIAAHPKATGADIHAALKKQKIRVSMPLIYQVLARSRKPRNGRRSRANSGGETINVASLMEAKRLVAYAGSIAEAERILKVLGKLRS